jgi:hypothetical protein
MTWEAVTALGTLFSAFVVAVAAIAAVVQIRHLRAGNQLEAILRIYDAFNSAEMMAARRYVLLELPEVLKDEHVRRSLAAPGQQIDPRMTRVGNFFNELGALVVDGFLEERLVWPLVPIAARAWRIVAPIALEWRRQQDDPVWADFEYIASLEDHVTRTTHIGRFPKAFRARLQSR